MTRSSVQLVAGVMVAWIAAGGCAGRAGDVADVGSDATLEDSLEAGPADAAWEAAPTAIGDGLTAGSSLLPFPSLALVRPDAASPTGYRLSLTPPLVPFPADPGGLGHYLERLNAADGFPVATPILALFPTVHVDAASLPSLDDLGASLQPGAAVQVLDSETGERVPVWAELDDRARDKAGAWRNDRRAMLVRPQRALGWGRLYTVVVTDAARDATGAPLPRPDWMERAVHGEPGGTPEREARRLHFERLLAGLEAAGVPRQRVVMAWQFPTMSRDFAQGPLLAIREQAAMLLPPLKFQYEYVCQSADPADAPTLGCEIETGLHPAIWRRLEGTFRVPSFLGPDGEIEWQDGAPVVQGWEEAPFVAVLPASIKDAANGTVGLVQIGHGLLSATRRYLMKAADENGTLDLVNDLGMIAAGTDFKGLSTDDLTDLVAMLGDFRQLWRLHDRLLQGMFNQYALTTLLQSTLADDPALLGPGGAPLLDDGRATYFGISLGAISGAVFALTSPRVSAAVLHVGSSMFSSLLQHSAEFNLLQQIVDAKIKDPLAQQGTYALTQRSFDPIDPATWHDRFLADPLPGVAPRSLLWQVSLGDANAPDFGAHALFRSAGVPLVTPSPCEVWGLERVAAPTAPGTTGAVIYDAQKEPPVRTNDGPKDNGAHHALRCLHLVHQQVRDFFAPGAEGSVVLHCGDGPCIVDGVDCRTSLGGR
jgi:hypothetical protein